MILDCNFVSVVLLLMSSKDNLVEKLTSILKSLFVRWCFFRPLWRDAYLTRTLLLNGHNDMIREYFHISEYAFKAIIIV